MKKGNIFVFVLLLGILILSTNAFALKPGDSFWFYDEVLPTTNPWTHDLYNLGYNDSFYPTLDGSEPNLIIERALLLLCFNFTPVDYVFNASVKLEGVTIGILDYHFSNNLLKEWIWSTKITNPITVFAGEANIEINVTKGTLGYVHNSVLLGSGVVGPEPISMALLGAGLAGLPIAVRFRRLLRK
jgi:hypothetical protein